MLPFELTELPNKSILKKISLGSKLNWIFIPGGPGLGEQYLETFLQDNKILKANVFIYRFPRYNSKFSDEEIFSNIKNDLLYLLENLENVVLVGHSFGGMLLQTLRLKNEYYKKIILLCSAPSLACFDYASLSFENFSNAEKKLITDLQLIYDQDKSDFNFKKLYKAWAPYYVTSNYYSTYLKMLDNCEFDSEFYEWGVRYFYNFFKNHSKIPENCIVLNSMKDQICPVSLFDNYSSFCEIHALDVSSHFPWVENSELFIKSLQNIEHIVDCASNL